MCHTRRESQLEEQFLRKVILVCPRNESDLGHTLLDNFSAVRPQKVTKKKKRKKKKKKKTRMAIAKLFVSNANAIKRQ